MILSLIVLLLVLLIGYFHYTQGLFSATLSAFIAVLASVLAVGYHESLAGMLSGGQLADQALAFTLVSIFAIVYIVLRALFDKFIPGNMRMPLWVDRIGAGVMGVVAGLFVTGVIVIAAQTLPFGPTIAGYSRYEIGANESVAVTIAGKNQQLDLEVVGKLKEDNIDAVGSGLLIPVDDMLLGVTSLLSDGGSLAGTRPLRSVHPDYLQELFGQRVGIQLGAKRTALAGQVSVPGVFWRDQFPQVDAEIPQIRKRSVPSPLKPSPDKVLLVVRAIFSKNSSDADNFVRFSPASVRLNAGGKNYFPIGTLEGGGMLVSNRIDDFLLVDLKAQDAGADFVFMVDASVAPPVDASGKQTDRLVAPGTFIEIKRFARIDLSGKVAPASVELSPAVAVLRKAIVMTTVRGGPEVPKP